MKIYEVETVQPLVNGKRDLKEIVGENIYKYRLEANIKRTHFCRLIGYQSCNLRKVEEGKMNMGLDKLQEVADVLGVGVIDLVEDWGVEG